MIVRQTLQHSGYAREGIDVHAEFAFQLARHCLLHHEVSFAVVVRIMQDFGQTSLDLVASADICRLGVQNMRTQDFLGLHVSHTVQHRLESLKLLYYNWHIHLLPIISLLAKLRLQV